MNKSFRSGVSWSAIDIICRQAIALLVMMVLARLLSPSDFGLMAMLTIFLAISSMLSDAGFSQALIQRQNVSIVDESSVFYFGLLLSITLSVILFLISPIVGNYFGYPILKSMLSVLSVGLIFNALGAVHIALLSKRLKFDVIAKAGIVSSIVGGSVAIIMAFQGFGVWSLVVQGLVGSLVNVILLWVLSNWQPQFVFSIQSIRHLFSYGGYITLDALMYIVMQNIQNILIGKYYSTAQAGIYSRSYGLMQLPLTVLTSIVSRVAYPHFSALVGVQDALRNSFRKILVATMFVTIPVVILLALLAKPFVLILLGKQWLEAVPILQILSIAAFFMPLQMLNITLLKALGHAKLTFHLMVIKFIVAMGILYVCLPYGLQAIAWSFVLSHVFNLFLNTYYSKKFLDFGLFEQLGSLLKNIMVGSGMIVVMLLCNEVLYVSFYLESFIALLLGVTFYGGLSYSLKVEGVEYMKLFLQRKKIS